MNTRFANVRQALWVPAALMAVLALGGCVSTPHRVAVPAKEMKLPELVDNLVEFTGIVQGPGPRGDYITISGTPVFLDKLESGDRNGQRATVTGRLRHYQPPTKAECKVDCDKPIIPAHYWIEDGKFKTPAAPKT